MKEIVGVTGASGFVGRELLGKLLKNGSSVRVLTRRPRLFDEIPVDVREGNLTAPDKSLQRFTDGLSVLYHCAGEIRKQEMVWETNTRGTVELARAAAGRVGRWVQLSSIGVYGPQRNKVVDEQTVAAPTNAYERSKLEADENLRRLGSDGSFEYVFLRPSNVFGPTMPNDSLRALTLAVANGRFFFIGRPGASANYVHVTNVSSALLLCGTVAGISGETFNLSNWSSMEEFIRAIADGGKVRRYREIRLPRWSAELAAAVGSVLPRFPLTAARVDALTTRTRYPIDKIRRIGYSDEVPLLEGVRDCARKWAEEAIGEKRS